MAAKEIGLLLASDIEKIMRHREDYALQNEQNGFGKKEKGP